MIKYLLIKITFLLTLFILSGHVSAQDTDSVTSEPIEDKYDFVILSGKYHNAFTFFGRDFGQSVPFLSSDLMYFFHSGFYINASGFKFLDTDLPIQSSLSLGYRRDLTKNTDLNVSYSQFLVSGNSTVAGIQNLGLLQTTFGLDWNYLYSTIQVQGLFSDRPDIFLSSQHSRFFQFDQKLFNAITVSFEPKFTLTAGSSRFYNLGDYPELDESEIQKLEKLNILSWDFNLPVTFEYKSFEMEVFSRYVAPLNTPEFDQSRNRFIHGIQLNYFLAIKR
ncbi:MAG TPA: hypothetical protein VK921_18500 [Anditalea sp.]|nr:hypothetical protein [Anditalea sp.]